MSDTLDFVSKLFDTLKEASKDSNTALQRLVAQQQELVNHVKGLPITELHQTLKDHDTKSTGEIDSCTETVESQTGTILKEVRDLKGKVRTMIIVVVVAFSLFTSAALIGKLVIESDYISHDDLKSEMIEEIKKTIDENH